jgi:prepilin-type processing-associated H-X9-DG protein
MAIISTLVAILMPALSAARRGGDATSCLANLHRIGVSTTMYLEQSDSRFPPVRLQTVNGQNYINEFGCEKPRWQWFLAFDIGAIIQPPRNSTAPWGDSYSTRLTNNYFLCPSLKGPAANDIRNGAYGYNYQYLGNSRTDTAPPEYDNFPVGQTQIPTPSQVVLVADSRGADPRHGKHSYTLDPPRLATEKNAAKFGPGAGDGPIAHSPAEARHSGRAAVSFVDGHAETLSLEQLGYDVGSDGVVIPDAKGASPRASNRLWGGGQ